MPSRSRKAARPTDFSGRNPSFVTKVTEKVLAFGYLQHHTRSWGREMKNWLLPAIVLGVSGVGLVFATEKGREQLRGLFDRISKSDNPLRTFNQAFEEQLDTIQHALDRLSQALEGQQLRN